MRCFYAITLLVGAAGHGSWDTHRNDPLEAPWDYRNGESLWKTDPRSGRAFARVARNHVQSLRECAKLCDALGASLPCARRRRGFLGARREEAS